MYRGSFQTERNISSSIVRLLSASSLRVGLKDSYQSNVYILNMKLA